MTEEALLDAVLTAARLFGWYTCHFRPAKTAAGWRTAVQGDGAGFPDLVLLRDRLVIAELKSDTGRVSPDQEAWLSRFRAAGYETHIWKPADWTSGTIESALR